MPPLKQPGTLENLALAAVSEYVHTIGQTVFKKICSQVSDPPLISEEETLNKNKFNLESLSTALYRGIPHVLWFDVTTSVLSAINKLIHNAQCSLDGFRTTGHQICKDFIEELTVTLITPYVTHIDFTDHVPFSYLFLAKYLDRMQRIKVLKIIGMKPKDVVSDHFAFPSSLTSFTMEHNCNDEIIRVLAHNCKTLQTLNVAKSLGVTDKSVRNIMTLQNLKRLHISDTKISAFGVWCILCPRKEVSGFAWKHIHSNLQSLGYNQEHTEQLHLIAHCFLSLTCISLRIVRCSDLKILSQMEHLKQFKVTGGNFIKDNMAGLLEAIGHQLEILELMIIQDVELGVIATHCVNLKILSLCHCSVAPLPQSPRLLTKSDKGLPFQRLEHLTFLVTCDGTQLLKFILDRCTALRSLVIGRIAGLDDNFISSCLSMNSLKKLELLKVSPGVQISLQSVHLLLKSCPNLSTLGGLKFSKNMQLCEISQLMESLKHKNYDIHIT